MTRARRLRWPALARTAAASIAVLALIDPGCTRERATRPLVALIDAANERTSGDSARVARVRASFASEADVVLGHLPTADAIVLLGDALPPAWRREPPTQPVFRLAADAGRPRLTWSPDPAPRTARVGEAATFEVPIEATGAEPADSAVLTARRDGVLLARVALPVRDTLRGRVRLTIVPVDTGVQAVDLALQWAGGPVVARQTAWIEVDTRRPTVASFERQPSWQATFVRRALERDTRFALSARVAVARVNGSELVRSRGAAPALGALPPPPALSALVVGSAEALGERERSLLDRWVREDGGSLLLLLDAPPTPELGRWLGVRAWQRIDRPEPIAAQWVRPDAAVIGSDVPVADSGATSPDDPTSQAADSARAPLRGRTWFAPTRLPDDAESWLRLALPPTADRSGDDTPVIAWSRALGRGTVLVVGAPDAWTFREATRSGFVATWPRLVAEMIARQAPAVALEVSPPSATGWRSARLVGSSEARRAWRSETDPTFVLVGPRGDSLALPSLGDEASAPATAWRTPAGDAWSRLVLRGGAGVPPLVSAVLPATVTTPTSETALDALVQATGGAVVPGASWPTLIDSVRARLQPAPRRTVWHPWRSPWWLLPFAGLLLSEWWWRRRRGQP